MSKATSALQDHAVINPPEACAICGDTAEDPTDVLTWSLEVQDDDHRWICIECARDHVREIEGRLDIDHWAPEV